MNKYREAELALARTLVQRWPDALVVGEEIVCSEAGRIPVPAYCSCQLKVDELVKTHGGRAEGWKGAAWVGNGDDAHFQHEPFENHEDEGKALRYASVLALTAILQAR